MQYSVFACDLTRRERRRFCVQLMRLIDERSDRIAIVPFVPLQMELIGRQLQPAMTEAIAVA